MKKKLLLAGGGYADIPLIKAGRQLGYHVITSGNRLDDMGHQYSDEHYLEDFSDKEAILKLAKNLKVDAICPCCNDFSAISCAYAAEKMGLPGYDSYDTTLIIHHKDEWRKFTHANNILSPKGMGFTNSNDALNTIKDWRFPMIVKPVDLSGGKGITKLTKMDDAPISVENALNLSKAGRIVVEEFIEGSPHGFSTFLRNGKIVFYFSDDEHYYINPYLVSAASTSALVSERVEKKLVLEAERISKILNLKDGIFHIQYILKGDEPFVVEITRRAPGDLYIQLVKHATAADYPSYIVKAAAGMDIGDISHAEPKGFFTRHCIMASQEGVVKDMIFDPSIQDKIIDKLLWGKPGDTVDDMMTSKLGIVFLKFASMEEMLEQTKMMPDLIRVVFH